MPTQFCEQCGARLPEDAKFCEACGQPVSTVTEGVASAPVLAAPSAPQNAGICSKCGQGDQVVAASQYNEGGDTIPDTDKLPDGEDRVDKEIVCDFLAKPEKPEPDGLGFWLILPFIPLLNFLLCWFAPMYRGFKFFMLGIVIVFWVCVFVPDLYEMSAYAFVGMFFILFYYSAIFIARDSRKADYISKIIPEYNRMAANWEHLQYCKRCQVVWLKTKPQRVDDLMDTEELLKS